MRTHTPFLALAITGFLTGSIASTTRSNNRPVMQQRSGITHLGIPVEHFGNAESAWVPPGGSDYTFSYDWSSTPRFETPADWSFVVTDILVTPVNPSTNQPYVRALILLCDDNQRQFEAIFRDNSQQRYQFTSGMVIGPDTRPRIYNDHNSDVQVQIQLLGYFIEGEPAPTAVAPPL